MSNNDKNHQPADHNFTNGMGVFFLFFLFFFFYFIYLFFFFLKFRRSPRMIYGTEAPVRHAHRKKKWFVILNRSADNFARVGTDLHYTPGYVDTQISKLVGCLFVLRLNVPVRKTL